MRRLNTGSRPSHASAKVLSCRGFISRLQPAIITKASEGVARQTDAEGSIRLVFKRTIRLLAIFTRLAFASIWSLAAAHAQVSVLTANYDNARTNSNIHETALNPGTVSTRTFGKVGTFAVDGQIYAQPLYVPGVQIKGKGTYNVVYVVTMNDSVYALDADAPQSTTPLWTVSLGTPIPSALFSFSDILPVVGILSTPVIDPARGALYVVANTIEQKTPVFELHALSLSDGSEMMNGPVAVSASVPGTGAGSDGGVLAFNPSLQLQRPGLALANGTVYLSFGSHEDLNNFHGWLIGYDALDLKQQKYVMSTTPNGWGGSIWQAGRAPAIDDRGDLFVTTGNGGFDGATEFGESLLQLSNSSFEPSGGDGSLQLGDWFTPENFGDLNDADWDFGSSGVMLVPGTHLLLAGAKSGTLYLAPIDLLGHMGGDRAGAVQAVKVNQWGMYDMALWVNQSGPIVYELEPCKALREFQIVDGKLDPKELSEFDTYTFFGGIAVSANGANNGTGIVWLTTQDTTTQGGPGTLHALDASNLSNELWSSGMLPNRDALGRFAKFVAPTVANGRVYVPTFSNVLVIYGLLSANPQDNGFPQLTAVVNGASFLGDSVAPGEIVAIFGANLGPSKPVDLQLDDQGKVSNALANTQVLFDGTPVPLLYTSSAQVGAVVPFGLSGGITRIQVVYQGNGSNVMTKPVTPAAPSLFSYDEDGGGVGAWNQDGTLNGWRTPAAPGSIIVMYATGLGQMNPPEPDGAVSAAPLAQPLLPVTVLFDGQPGQVLYAGAAPGKIAGMIQINARVPDTITFNSNVQVVIKVGDSYSPNALTLNVQ